jgi:hypothetical protein
VILIFMPGGLAGWVGRLFDERRKVLGEAS